MEDPEDNVMNMGARPKETRRKPEGPPDESSADEEGDVAQQEALQSQKRPRQGQDPLVAGAGRGWGRGLPFGPSESVLPSAPGRSGGSEGRGATLYSHK